MESSSAHADASDAVEQTEDFRRRLVFCLIVGGYVAAVLGFALLGYKGSMTKTMVLPAVLLCALVTNRFRAFTRDWLVFLAAVMLFDNVRALLFGFIAHFEWPVYLNYVIDWERALLAGGVAPELLQSWLGTSSELGFFDELMVVVHGSHFLYFLMFSLGVWSLAPETFPRCRRAMMLMMALGLVCYALVPTVPPHLAAESFGAIPPIYHVTTEVYRSAVPGLLRIFDTNPIAAMPSLHAAFPSLCAMIAAYHLRWRAWPFVLYALCIYFSIMYLGEHYLVDVLFGMLLAFVCFATMYLADDGGWWDKLKRGAQRVFTAPGNANGGALVHPVFLALLLIASSELSEHAATKLRPTSWVHAGFARSELSARPAEQALYLGADAYGKQDLVTAIEYYEQALALFEEPRKRDYVRDMMARSAYFLGDHARTAEVLSGVEVSVRAETRLIQGISLSELGDFEAAEKQLRGVAAHTGDPRAIYWLALSRWRSGEATRDDTLGIAQRLGEMGGDEKSVQLSRALAQAVGGS